MKTLNKNNIHLMNIRLPHDVWRGLKLSSLDEQRAMTAIILDAVRNYLTTQAAAR